MFEVPGSDIVEVIIGSEVVKEGKPPQYITRPEEEKENNDMDTVSTTTSYDEDQVSVKGG